MAQLTLALETCVKGNNQSPTIPAHALMLVLVVNTDYTVPHLLTALMEQ
jgi:hypothetical protein